jgi:hypothetical protein
MVSFSFFIYSPENINILYSLISKPMDATCPISSSSRYLRQPLARTSISEALLNLFCFFSFFCDTLPSPTLTRGSGVAPPPNRTTTCRRIHHRPLTSSMSDDNKSPKKPPPNSRHHPPTDDVTTSPLLHHTTRTYVGSTTRPLYRCRCCPPNPMLTPQSESPTF